jgi:hypothetical protein
LKIGRRRITLIFDEPSKSSDRCCNVDHCGWSWPRFFPAAAERRRNPKPHMSAATPAAAPTTAPPPDPMEQSLNDIVARYRKTIVLLDDDADAQAADRDRASLVGKIIFRKIIRRSLSYPNSSARNRKGWRLFQGRFPMWNGFSIWSRPNRNFTMRTSWCFGKYSPI